MFEQSGGLEWGLERLVQQPLLLMTLQSPYEVLLGPRYVPRKTDISGIKAFKGKIEHKITSLNTQVDGIIQERDAYARPIGD